MSGSGADIQDVDAPLELLDDTKSQRQDRVDQRRVVNPRRLVSLDHLECVVGGVRHTASLPEDANDLGLDRSHERRVLREEREVVRAGSLARRTFGDPRLSELGQRIEPRPSRCSTRPR